MLIKCEISVVKYKAVLKKHGLWCALLTVMSYVIFIICSSIVSYLCDLEFVAKNTYLHIYMWILVTFGLYELVYKPDNNLMSSSEITGDKEFWIDMLRYLSPFFVFLVFGYFNVLSLSQHELEHMVWNGVCIIWNVILICIYCYNLWILLENYDENYDSSVMPFYLMIPWMLLAYISMLLCNPVNLKDWIHCDIDISLYNHDGSWYEIRYRQLIDSIHLSEYDFINMILIICCICGLCSINEIMSSFIFVCLLGVVICVIHSFNNDNSFIQHISTIIFKIIGNVGLVFVVASILITVCGFLWKLLKYLEENFGIFENIHWW